MPTDPTADPANYPSLHAFIHYNLLFTGGGPELKVSANPEEYIDVELIAGTWKVEVYGYTNFNLPNTDTHHLAAYGTNSITVANGGGDAAGLVNVTVTITPIPVDGLPSGASDEPNWWGTGAYDAWETAPDTTSLINDKGIFTYNLIFPTSVTDATLKLVPVVVPATTATTALTLTSTPALANGAWASISVDPGYYDMFITLKKPTPHGETQGNATNPALYTIAGVYSAVHIYAGMETLAEYTFTEAADFFDTVNLAGTVMLGIPSNVTVSGLKVTAYRDEDCTVPLTGGTALVDTDDGDDAEWSITTGITQGTTTLNKWLLTVPYYQTQYKNYTDSTSGKIYDGVYLKVTVTRSPHDVAQIPTPAWTTRDTVTRVPIHYGGSTPTVAPIPQSGVSGIALTMNIGGVRVVFDDHPEDENWILDGLEGTLYWRDSTNAAYTRGTPMTITVPSTAPTYENYAWYLDYIDIGDNTDTLILRAIAANTNTIAVEAQDFREGKHTLTCRVTKTTDAPQDDTPYSKTVTFTVARNR
jgi:hypothetical protein